jgi:hypothetical protein
MIGRIYVEQIWRTLKSAEGFTAMSFQLAIHVSLLGLAACWGVAICLVLVLAVPLCVTAKRADVAEVRETEAVLDYLADLHGPSGQPFFPAPDARDEFAEELRELRMLVPS